MLAACLVLFFSARQAAVELQGRLPTTLPVRVLTSDFTRARETAAIVHTALRLPVPVETDLRLRERFFGEHNGLGAWRLWA